MSQQTHEQSIFEIDYQIITPTGTNKGVELRDGTYPTDILPRVGDTLDVDSCLYNVVAVIYSYKTPYTPTVLLKSVGDFQQFVQSLVHSQHHTI
jgi:hypothetical protein